MFSGSITALITPFIENTLDETALKTFIEWQISQGTDGLVPCGTTGESPVLSHEEHKRVIEITVEVAKGNIPVIAGSGSNSTEEAIHLSQHAERSGVDALLLVTPYYNKPNQEGLKAHFLSIANAVNIPIIIYNIPPRSSVDMNMETMQELSFHPNIVGVKDATGDLNRPLEARLNISTDFCLLSGDDETTVAYLAQGGHGCVSVLSNVAPMLSAKLHKAWKKGDLPEVCRLRDLLHPLSNTLFVEPNPAPIKFACSLLSKCLPDTRLPMIPLTEQSKIRIESAMQNAGLI